MYSIIHFEGKPSISRNANGAVVPADIRNSDFRDFLAWNAQQATPLDYETILPINTVISASDAVIIGDGVDEITLTVRGEPDALVTINTLCGATPGTINVQLDKGGSGSQVFSCETSPCVIVFSAGESTCKVRAL